MRATEADVHNFIRELQKWVPRPSKQKDGREKGDRAAMAALRRGLGRKPGEAPEVFPYLVPLTCDLDDTSQEDFFLAASLFALHPETWHAPETEKPWESWQRNFGASMRCVALKESAPKQPGSVLGTSVEQRFVALLDSNSDELPNRLRHAVSLCKSKDVPVDWERLLVHLTQWGDASRYVQRTWARAFWYEPRKDEDDDEDFEGN